MSAAQRQLGPYEILASVGAGGMGEVFRARDTRLGRIVAIKILNPGFSSDLAQRSRFEREARSISQVHHPGVCALYDFGHDEATDTDYLVLEYVEGETLAIRLRRGALPVTDALRAAIEIAEGMSSAHRVGLVHRDLKPGNIILAASGAKLLDFGLAKPVRGSAASHQAHFGDGASTTTGQAVALSTITQEGTIVGTFQYMSPEQVEGREVDARSDIFSFGAVLYEMVTGRAAFSGKSQISIASAILEKNPEPVSVTQPLVPAALDHVIATCLAKDPEHRWQNAADIARELTWILSGENRAAAAIQPRPVRTLNWLLALGLVAATVLAAVYIFSRGVPSSRPVIRAFLNPVNDYRFQLTGLSAGPPVISPDGKRVVYAMDGPGGQSLWVRTLSSETPHRLAGTENASFPFWSSDSKQIAFFAAGYVRKVSADLDL